MDIQIYKISRYTTAYFCILIFSRAAETCPPLPVQVAIHETRHGVVAQRRLIDRDRPLGGGQLGEFDAVEHSVERLVRELVARHPHRIGQPERTVAEQPPERLRGAQRGEIALPSRLDQGKFVKPLPNIVRPAAVQQRAVSVGQVQVIEPAVARMDAARLDRAFADRSGRQRQAVLR